VDLAREAAAALGRPVTGIDPLGGGCVSEVYRLTLADGSRVVAKVDYSGTALLPVEAAMLRALHAAGLPVPAVLHVAPALLLLAFLDGESRFSPAAEAHAADLLADLHDHSAPCFGYDHDTLIGGLRQPNPWAERWLPFFAEQRLVGMGREANRLGRLSNPAFERVQRLAADLARWLSEPARPSLIHGDVWTTNVMARGDRVVGFLDPAIYYADPEIELAFITLFGTFGRPFFERYAERRPIAPGFFEERRHLYNLYPLLVHTRLFGGSYAAAVEQTLARFGY
jgi:fructosamine-3-kinase